MATKKELLEKAKELGLELDEKLKIAEIEEQIKATTNQENADVAKAGKRSAKSLKEKEELESKAKAKEEAADTKPKQIAKPTRSKLERKGKNLRSAYSLLEKDKAYDLSSAVDLAKKTSKTKFDASVELHINLNVDPRHADQNIRDMVILPAGSGKKVKVAVFTEDPKAATSFGADIAGSDEFLQQLDKGKFDFDILITSPNLMPKLSKYARVLGPKGLMPNPKSGTVTTDVEKAIKESKGGKVEYRVDSNGIIHLGVGKVSFKNEDLLENINAAISSIKSNKPTSIKGAFVKSIYLATSMGPAIKIEN